MVKTIIRYKTFPKGNFCLTSSFEGVIFISTKTKKMKKRLLIWIKKMLYSFLFVFALFMFLGGYTILMTGFVLLPEDFFGINLYAYADRHFYLGPIIGMGIILLSFKLIGIYNKHPEAK